MKVNIKIILKNLFFCAIINLLVISCGLVPTEVQYDDSNSTYQDIIFSDGWANSSYPITLNISTDITNTSAASFVSFQTQLQNAADTWNNGMGKNLIKLSFGSLTLTGTDFTNLYAPLDNDYHGVYFDRSLWFQNTGKGRTVLATTIFDFIESQITNSSMRFNRETYNFQDSNGTTCSNCVDLESVFLHELGHFLGLGHVNETDSIMYPSISLNTTKRVLSTNDIRRIKLIYNKFLN